MKSLVSLIILFISLNSFASETSNNKMGVWITPKSIPQNQLQLKSGDDFKFEGDICVVQLGEEDHHQKCLKVSDHKLVFKAYFPDSLHDVSDKLVITQSKDKKSWRYSLKTDKLQSSDLNQLTLTVGTDNKTNDKKTNELLSIKAKIEKRILILKDFENNHSSKLTVYLKSLVSKIDAALLKNPEILAQIRVPLNVDYKVSVPFYYSSNFKGFKLTLNIPVGLPYEGVNTELFASVTNLSDKKFYFPEIEKDKNNEKNDEKDKQHYRLGIEIDGKSLISTNPFDLALGETKTITAKTEKLNSSDINKILLNFKSSSKNLGYLSYNLPVLKEIAPIASLACSTNNLLVNCNALSSFDPKGGPFTFTFDYADGFSESNASGISSHAYTLPGLYNVKLTVSNLAGISSNAFAQVQPMLPPNILPNLSLNCISNSINVLECNAIGSSDPDGTIVSYQYAWDDNTVDTKADPSVLTHTFATAGSHTVVLTAIDNDGGVSTLSKSFIVLANTIPVASFTCDTTKPWRISCQSTSTDADVGDSIVSTSWITSNSTLSSTLANPEFNFQKGGIFNVTLSVTDSHGGVGSVTQAITVKDNSAPIANFTCMNTTVQSIHCDSTSNDSDGTIASSSWILDDGSTFTGVSFDHAFANDLAHSVSLTVVDDLGASSTANQSIQVIKNQLPTFDIATDVLSGTLPLTVNFNAVNVVDIDGTIASYSWDFGDTVNPQVASTSTASHTFTKAGTYTVKLLVTDNNNGVTTKSVTISTSSAINFVVTTDIDTGFVPLKVHFDASQSTSPDSTIATLEWFYKGVSIGTGAIIDYTFADIGSLNVSLVATDILGIKSSTTKTITTSLEPLKYPPAAFFKVFEFNTMVELHAFITKTQFDIKRAYYTVDGTSTVQMTEFFPNTVNMVDLKTYGDHQIDLTVEDIRGQITTFTHKFTLAQDHSTLLPFADFSAVQSSVRTVFFDFSKSFDFDFAIDTPIKNFHIDYGNGETEDTPNLYTNHTYPAAGTYQVTVTATTNYNTKSSVTHEVIVTNDNVAILNPVAHFVYQIFGFAQNVSFYMNGAGTPNGNIISYLWDFGDGQTATGPVVAHFYNPGSYFVTLTVTDSAGMKSSQTQHIIIYQAGTDLAAGIDCSLAKPFVEIAQQCKAIALDKQNQITNVLVNWGDGVTESLTPQVASIGYYLPTHKYSAAGFYLIDMTLTTSRGETKTTYNSVTLTNFTPPPAQIVASLNCSAYNMNVFCNAMGTYDLSGSPLTYTFDYGGFTDTNAFGASSFNYPGPGLYTVKLTVTNANGQQATAQTQVQTVLAVNQAPIANLGCFSSAPNILTCNANGSVDFDGTIISYKYDWDDGSSDVRGDNGSIIHIFQTSGSHQVNLTVTDNDGGGTSISNSFNVIVNHPPIASMTCSTPGPQRVVCYSTSTDPDPGDQIAEYKWDLGDGTILTSLIPSVDYNYSAASTYTVSLTVKDSFGATSTTTQQVTTTVNQPPVANINCYVTTGTTYQCDSNAYDSDGSVANQIWTIDGQSLSGPSIQYNFTNGGSYPVSLTVTDNFGGAAIFSTTISINKPIVSFSCRETNPMVYQCFSGNLVSNDPNDPIVSVNYLFDNKDILSDLNVEYEFHSFGTHSVQINVTTASGNVSTSTQAININQKYLSPNPVFIEDVLLGQKVYFDGSLSGQVGRTVTSYEWDFGDGQTLVTTDPINTHQYNAFGWYDVKLKVTDATGVSAISTTPIYVYDPEVDAPGDEGFATIEGVDVDNDGVRDDVQRWINKNSFESTAAKKGFRELAGVYKSQIANSDNVTTLQSLEDQKATIAACVNSEIASEHGITKSVEFELIYLNTNDRVLNFAKIKGNLSGYVPKVTITSATDPCVKWR